MGHHLHPLSWHFFWLVVCCAFLSMAVGLRKIEAGNPQCLWVSRSVYTWHGVLFWERERDREQEWREAHDRGHTVTCAKPIKAGKYGCPASSGWSLWKDSGIEPLTRPRCRLLPTLRLRQQTRKSSSFISCNLPYNWSHVVPESFLNLFRGNLLWKIKKGGGKKLLFITSRVAQVSQNILSCCRKVAR